MKTVGMSKKITKLRMYLVISFSFCTGMRVSEQANFFMVILRIMVGCRKAIYSTYRYLVTDKLVSGQDYFVFGIQMRGGGYNMQ
jgi:hypothetical protein